MKIAEKMKKLRDETGYPFSVIRPLLNDHVCIDEIRKELIDRKMKDLDSLMVELSLSKDKVESLYFQFNCDVNRALNETKNKRIFSIDEKKQSIKEGLESGNFLVGNLSQVSSSNSYSWIRISKREKKYYFEKFIFSKDNIDKELDLIYSDALSYDEKSYANIDDVIAAIESKMDIEKFDTVESYDKFPL